MIVIKSPREIALMREAGKLLASTFLELGKLVVPGVSTLYLSEQAERLIEAGGGKSAEKGYCGFPGAICASVNEVLVHGIPSAKKILRDGDIVSLDIVVTLNGYCADACRTYPVGVCSPRALRMIQIAEEAFARGVAPIKEGIHLGDVEHEIEATAKEYGCSVPREFTGHGIGATMHEDPYIPNYGSKGSGPLLKAGMTLAIEPMILEGRPEVRTLKDGWTTLSKDGKLTSHYENTVLVTKDGYEILTKV